MNNIVYKGITYPVRNIVVKFQPPGLEAKEYQVKIGTDSLMDILDHENRIVDQRIDEMIYHYVADDEINIPGPELVKVINDSDPDHEYISEA